MKSQDLIAFYKSEINKVIADLNSYESEEALWKVLPGTLNSGGNLGQHLIGNLKAFIGNPFGHINYERHRDAEFSERSFTREELTTTLAAVAEIVAESIASVSEKELLEAYPIEIKAISNANSVGSMFIYLLAHLSYHAGQINYHRRYFNTQ